MRHALLLASLCVLLAVSPGPGAEAGDPTGDVADDVRVGTVLTAQGVASVRPAGHRRWTPVGKDTVLLPGDWLRTSLRGANAVEVALRPHGTLLLGPGSLVELPEAGRMRLLQGEAEVQGTADVEGKAWFRADEEGSSELDEAPRWARDYRATVGQEWMGSLLAKVDGRDVPLAVGFHKVTADIRDQIARTTVVQSFVNATKERLEGVFYFPLPADASISGFAMWIGDELVEADVVEKARARQIYEDILRRKKDPGLLEWQGGNLFKARVFPIEPHSEKRIRLRYTQVLPLEGSTFRYRYALRSDLLRSRPLRQLDVQVNVLSGQKIQQVVSSTHPVRVSKTDHEARAEFAAESYVPTRDFEVAVTLEASKGLTAVTHRRGDDGYLMLLLAPPAAEAGGWQRELLPEGDPVEVVLLADTSGSMDVRAREVQAEFVASLLGLLGDDDRFRLAASDVDVHWAFEGARPVTEANVTQALAFLEDRRSLGWSDLERGLGAALEVAGPGALVVYVGDGIPTTGDADPTQAADRLRLLGRESRGVVHAVACASTYEQGVLDALASIGGGSVRRADTGAAASAYGLLAEATRPLLRDAKVEVRGFETAALHPPTLPNVAVGRQQVVLARFRPTEAAAEAEVVVEGRIGGETVRYATAVHLSPPGQGNSFLPRLWARKHLDHLLARGTSAAVQQEIVGFSRDFGIITPYTSFLVLESDADRERYGVTRTVQMRDGEAFFAAGRDRVALEMLRKHTRDARAWRVGLKRRMLKEVERLGRDLVPLRPIESVALGETLVEHRTADRGLGSGGGFRGRGGSRGLHRGAPAPMRERGLSTANPLFVTAGAEPVIKDGEIADHVETDNDLPFEESLGEDGLSDAPFTGPSNNGLIGLDRSGADELDSSRVELLRSSRRIRGLGDDSQGIGSVSLRPDAADDDLFFGSSANPYGLATRDRGIQATQQFVEEAPRASGRMRVTTLGWPSAPRVPRTARKRPTPTWDPEVASLLRRLDRRPALGRLAGGFVVQRNDYSVHPARNELTATSTSSVLWARDRWAVRGGAEGGELVEAWADEEHRVRIHSWRRLGRRRPSVEADVREAPPSIENVDVEAFTARHGRSQVVVSARRGPIVDVRLLASRLHGTDRTFRLDLRRNVVLEERTEQDGVTTQRRRFTGFVEVGGLWWPRLAETFDQRGRLVSASTLNVEYAAPDAFAAAFASRKAGTDDVLFLGPTLPVTEDARRALREGRAAFADHLAIALHEAGTQQWEATFAAWAAATQAAGERPGIAWAELALLAQARRGPALLAHANALAARLGSAPGGPGASWRAKTCYDHAASRLGAEERLELLGRLAEPWTLPGGRPLLRFLLTHAAVLEQVHRRDAARGVRARALALRPHDVSLLLHRATDMQRSGHVPEARAFLHDLLFERREVPVFTLEEEWQLLDRYLNLLWSERDLDALDEVTARGVELVPEIPEVHGRRYTVALLRGRAQAVDQAVVDALAAPIPDDPSSAAFARLAAALKLALGTGWNVSARQVLPAYRPALLGLGRRAAAKGGAARQLLATLHGNWRFRRLDGQRLLDEGLVEDLLSGGAVWTMPLQRLDVYVSTVPWDDVERRDVRRVLAALEARWTFATAGRDRDALTEMLFLLHRQRGDHEGQLDVLRAARAAATGFRRAELAAQLFDLLTRRRWNEAREREAFRLLPDLLDPTAEEVHERTAAVAARRLATWGFAGRRSRALGGAAAREARSRAEGREADRRAKLAAGRAVAARLRVAMAEAPPVCRRWFDLERLGYAIETGEQTTPTIAEAHERLDGVAKTSDDPWDGVVAERAALVLAYAATRPKAADGVADELLAWLDARAADAADERLDWRYETFRLLAALDRVDALETRLTAWSREADAPVVWGVTLAYLEAERGRLADAATRLEAAAQAGDLSARTWHRLAGWYLALGDDERRLRALERGYEATEPWQLKSAIQQQAGRAAPRRGQVPEDVDPEVFRMLRVLLAKATEPKEHFYALRALYRAARDHRTLASIAEAVPGHTPGALYDLVRRLAPLVAEVYEEATVDAAVAGVRDVRAEVRLPHERRALDVLEALLLARATRGRQGDPAHVSGAAAALGRVGEGSFETGERRRVADLVAALPEMHGAEVRAAQLTLLRQVLDGQAVGSPDRLAIAAALSLALEGAGESDASIDVLRSALDEERARTEGRLAHAALRTFNVFVERLVRANRHRDAETALRDEQGRQDTRARKLDLELRLLRLHGEALRAGAALSLGQGATLLDEATTAADAFLSSSPASRARSAVGAVVTLHQAAQEAGAVDDAAARLEAWARERLGGQLDRFVVEGTSMVRSVGRGLHDLGRSKHALGYVLDRIETEPAYVDRLSLDAWSSTHNDLARWRPEASKLGELDARLLGPTVASLETWLRGGQRTGRRLWGTTYTTYWAEHVNEFAAAASRVAELESDDDTVQRRCAEYLRELGRNASAVALLTSARAREAIDSNGLRLLAKWLVEDKRHDEAIEVVESYFWEPTTDDRVFTMRVYFGAGRVATAHRLLAEAEATARQRERLAYRVAEKLGRAALAIDAPETAERLLEENVRLRVEKLARATANAYHYLAQARMALGKTDAAVEAASAGIVAAGRSASGRQRLAANERLEALLASAADLDAFVERHEARVAEEGLDAPVLRRALAAVYGKRDAPAKALPHLLAARELAPEDVEVHRRLVATYDALGKANEALEALLTSLALAPRNLEAAADLAKRFAAAGDGVEAERARTNLVEPLPHEAAGHRRLALLREEAKELPAAEEQWRQVVRTDPLDPTGWLLLARVQVGLDDTAGARKSLEHVLSRDWEDRFGDVKKQAAGLMTALKD